MEQVATSATKAVIATPERLDRITQAKLATGSANATVNRILALVRAILRRCERDWEWVDKSPAVRLLKEPTKRIR